MNLYEYNKRGLRLLALLLVASAIAYGASMLPYPWPVVVGMFAGYIKGAWDTMPRRYDNVSKWRKYKFKKREL